MKRLLLMIFCFWMISASAQELKRPKLVVGLVIDQMRWDYLYRYFDRYAEGGFKRLLKEGFSCENTHLNHLPTYTGAGHATIFTGSVPAIHGIIGNSWYDRKLKRIVYCTEDSSVTSVGTSAASGKMSPKNMWGTSITDELRLATNFKSKTIAISLKDRGSIFPGGHTANGAYWFDNASAGWITSSFYMPQLPAWVQDFNNKKLPEVYLSQDWNTLYAISTYTQSTADSNRYETRLGGGGITFPHITKNLGNNKYEVFRYLPASNTYCFEFAKAALKAEQLGKRGTTDFLSLSLSQPDYSGHSFAPNSIEMEDTYLRLDRDLAAFLKHLDATIGKDQYLLFLSSDHGAALNPIFVADHKIQAGVFEESRVRTELNALLEKQFGTKGIIEKWINYQIYLDHDLIARNKLDKKTISDLIIAYLIMEPGISNAVDLDAQKDARVHQKINTMIVNGYNPRLSGDVQYILRPQWFETWRTGTTHGSWYPYDTHIPLIFMGWNIKPGKLYREVHMQDIAPTIAALLKIQMPNASIGEVIGEVVR
ncbi:MAG: alkaline phosphatase family protein [Flavisolibacter sp.]|nr:alkaline phosphatase family protein [Flavisolibacter sp.]